ncbi:MAG: minor capsid protein [Candidatus Sericytochromatia bacterium]|nr:minor capsid protein [Candidatus Sericytochromatia bacterium]
MQAAGMGVLGLTRAQPLKLDAYEMFSGPQDITSPGYPDLPDFSLSLASGGKKFGEIQRDVDRFARDSSLLIKDIGDKAARDIELLVQDAVYRGTMTSELTQQIEGILSGIMQDQKDKVQARAALIARDQIGKLNGNINRTRQETAGIKRYRWRTNMDGRQRPEHSARNGQIFSWDKPPADGHPGQPVRCRCVPEPVFEEDDFGLTPEELAEEAAEIAAYERTQKRLPEVKTHKEPGAAKKPKESKPKPPKAEKPKADPEKPKQEPEKPKPPKAEAEKPKPEPTASGSGPQEPRQPAEPARPAEPSVTSSPPAGPAPAQTPAQPPGRPPAGNTPPPTGGQRPAAGSAPPPAGSSGDRPAPAVPARPTIQPASSTPAASPNRLPSRELPQPGQFPIKLDRQVPFQELNQQQKMVLRYNQLAQTMPDPAEMIVAWDRFGVERDMSIGPVPGRRMSVRLNKPPSELKNMTVTHNHPDVGSSFSDLDIQSAIDYDLATIEAIGVHRGTSLIYRASKPIFGWPRITMNETLRDACKSVLGENRRYFQSTLISGALSRDDLTVWARNIAMIEFSLLYGLQYSVEEIVEINF